MHIEVTQNGAVGIITVVGRPVNTNLIDIQERGAAIHMVGNRDIVWAIAKVSCEVLMRS